MNCEEYSNGKQIENSSLTILARHISMLQSNFIMKSVQAGWLGFYGIMTRDLLIYFYAPVAQLDRVSGFEPGGRRFESCQPRQISSLLSNLSFLTLFFDFLCYEKCLNSSCL